MVNKSIKVAKVEKVGEKLIIPERMDYDDAIRTLRELKEQEDQETQFSEIIENAFPMDGAYAMAAVLEETFGFVCARPTPGFFGDKPPQIRHVPSGPNGQTVAVPWGRLAVPGIDGYLQLAAAIQRGRLCFAMTGVVKRKHEDQLKALGVKVREFLKHSSLYRGKVFNIQFTNEAGEALDPLEIEPGYLDVSGINPDELILPEETQNWFDNYFMTHIRYSDQAREIGVPGKWGALLEGPPGTGKTMGIMIASKLASEKGVTVIYVNNFSDFEPAVRMAVQYQPAMLVMEDLDRLVSTEEEDNKLTSKVQNILDGIESKNADVRLVFTSNYAERLTNTIVRPGRIDLMIPFQAPDAVAAEKLIKLYARGLLRAGETLHEVGKILSGQIAASIRGVVEKAKLAALNSAGGNILGLEITEEHLIHAANSMKRQMEMLNRKENPILSERERAAKIIVKGFARLKGHSEEEIETFLNGNGLIDEEEQPLLGD